MSRTTALISAFFITVDIWAPMAPAREYNLKSPMVPDGYYYACRFLVLRCSWAGWLGRYGPFPLFCSPFFLWFFRDPERRSRTTPGAMVSPADGKVTDVALLVTWTVCRRTRISIFLNVFDVHVNRSPIAGVIREVRYQKGKFLNAMAAIRPTTTSRTRSRLKATDRP